MFLSIYYVLFNICFNSNNKTTDLSSQKVSKYVCVKFSGTDAVSYNYLINSNLFTYVYDF